MQRETSIVYFLYKQTSSICSLCFQFEVLDVASLSVLIQTDSVKALSHLLFGGIKEIKQQLLRQDYAQTSRDPLKICL